MSLDTGLTPENGGENRIVLVEVKQSYWLLEGEQHLDSMLSGLKPFPRPVHCVQFDSTFALNLFLPDGQTVMALWQIHPEIVERLRVDGDLVVIDPPNED